MALPAPHYLALGEEDNEASSPCGSDVSDMLPRRLRYSEAVLPPHFCDDILDNNKSPERVAASNDRRLLKVYARIKPAALNNAAAGGNPSSSAAAASTSAAAGPVEGGTATTTTAAAAASLPGPAAPLQATETEVQLRMRDGGTTTFSFDRVFQGSEQQAFFDAAVEPLVKDLVWLRTGCSVFMSYGASGTGKSYTMHGTAAQPGMIPRTLQRVFELLWDRGLEHQVHLSFYEVYGNKVTDLLRPLKTAAAGVGAVAGGRPPGGGGAKAPPHHHHQQQQPQPTLPIVRVGAGFCLPGLLQCHIRSPEEGRALHAAAARLRKREATRVNSESSRSHAVFTVQLVEVAGGRAAGRSATLSLVDLAGAERAAQTQHVGNKLRESAGINFSLSVLRRCLEALRHNQAAAQRAAAAAGAAGGWWPAAPRPLVPPVRESGLTTLFAGVLSGQGGGNLALSVHFNAPLPPPPTGQQQMPASAVAATSTASSDDYAMTLETLRFGALAAKLQVSAAPPPEAAAMAVVALPPQAAPRAAAGGPSWSCCNARRLAAMPGPMGLQEPIPEEPIAEAAEEEKEELYGAGVALVTADNKEAAQAVAAAAGDTEGTEEAARAKLDSPMDQDDQTDEQYDGRDARMEGEPGPPGRAGPPGGQQPGKATAAGPSPAAAAAAAVDGTMREGRGAAAGELGQAAARAAEAVQAAACCGVAVAGSSTDACAGSNGDGAEAVEAADPGAAGAAGKRAWPIEQAAAARAAVGPPPCSAAAAGSEPSSLQRRLSECRRELQLERAAREAVEQRLSAALQSEADLKLQLLRLREQVAHIQTQPQAQHEPQQQQPQAPLPLPPLPPPLEQPQRQPQQQQDPAPPGYLTTGSGTCGACGRRSRNATAAPLAAVVVRKQQQAAAAAAAAGSAGGSGGASRSAGRQQGQQRDASTRAGKRRRGQASGGGGDGNKLDADKDEDDDGREPAAAAMAAMAAAAKGADRDTGGSGGEGQGGGSQHSVSPVAGRTRRKRQAVRR